MRDAQALQQKAVASLLARALERLLAHQTEREHVDEALLLAALAGWPPLAEFECRSASCCSAQALSSWKRGEPPAVSFSISTDSESARAVLRSGRVIADVTRGQARHDRVNHAPDEAADHDPEQREEGQLARRKVQREQAVARVQRRGEQGQEPKVDVRPKPGRHRALAERQLLLQAALAQRIEEADAAQRKRAQPEQHAA